MADTNTTQTPSGIRVHNGINRYEALLLAEANLPVTHMERYFGAITPVILEDPEVLRFEKYWFVDYTPEVHMTYPSLLIVIKKTTGDVVEVREYLPESLKETIAFMEEEGIIQP